MNRLAAVELCLAASLGMAVGVGIHTFFYAHGASYLTNAPEACANCHIMQEHYDGWLKSPHRSVAVCNDCHTPEHLIPKYFTKGSNGFWHSFAFTTGWFPDPLTIKSHNRLITEDACRRCHADTVEAMEGTHPGIRSGHSCVRCHNSVGHLANGPGNPLEVRLR